MSGPPMPDGFWEWLADQDPESVPFRAEISDRELAKLVNYARNHTQRDRQIPLSELMECGSR